MVGRRVFREGEGEEAAGVLRGRGGGGGGVQGHGGGVDEAHLLSSRGRLTVTVAVTTENHPLLDPLLSRSPTVVPLVLPFPDYPDLPPGLENSKDLPPGSFLHLMHAIAGLRDPLLRWARSTPNPPTAIISDFFLGWTTDLAAELGVPGVFFSPSGALAVAASFLRRESMWPWAGYEMSSTWGPRTSMATSVFASPPLPNSRGHVCFRFRPSRHVGESFDG